MHKRDEAAIAAVARHFSAKQESGGKSSPDTQLTIAGKRIAVAVVAIKETLAPPPRLRFDKGALRFHADMRESLRTIMPDGGTLLITITAPIRQRSKTAADLDDRIRTRLSRRPARLEMKETIHGNQIRVRLMSGAPGGVPKTIGYVHNPETDAEALLRFVQDLLQQIGAAANNRTGAYWLVIANAYTSLSIETCRQIFSQFHSLTAFDRILLVSAEGQVEELTR